MTATTRMRLDEALVARGLAPSRSRARDMVKRGTVAVDGETETRPARMVSDDAAIAANDDAAGYVSRAALKLIADGVSAPVDARAEHVDAPSGSNWVPTRRDMPSFTVEALPVDTFEALLLAAAALGEVEDDDPPYGLDVLMSAPLGCWCHLSVVPDAGASTVSIAVAPEPEAALPPIERVRDAWITELNSLDWSTLH